MHPHVFVSICEITCCTMVVNSKQSCTMLFFSNEYSVTLANGDLKGKNRDHDQTNASETVNMW